MLAKSLEKTFLDAGLAKSLEKKTALFSNLIVCRYGTDYLVYSSSYSVVIHRN